MTISPFLVLRVHRVGSCFAIAELEYAAKCRQSDLDAEAQTISELDAALDRFPMRKNGFIEHTVAARQARAADLERQLQAISAKIEVVLALGPMVGSESIPWSVPGVPLRALDEVFPGLCLTPKGVAL